MKEAFGKPLHFRTTNEPLAYALHTVGFPCIGVFNRYTDATLDHLKMPTATAAMEAGKPGQLEYIFEQADDLPRALEMWDTAGKELGDGEQIQLSLPRAEAITIARAVMRGYLPFKSEWKKFPGYYIQPNTGEAVKMEGGMELPGFKVASTNLNPVDKAKLFSK